jgi:AbrB family looped-hinge helix DNA binding protein
VKSTVQSRGQVTLPKSIRDRANIAPGDLVEFQVVGPHKVMIEVIPVKPLQYFWDKFATDDTYDDDANRAAWQVEAAAETMDE